MSIIKSILHKYNATFKAYDTLHPETESAQITDWHKAVVNSLASTTLPAVVSALTTDSVMGKLMKLVLTASGVKYSIAQNGYVCLGSFFGGLIIQWGKDEQTSGSNQSDSYSISLPISCNKMLTVVVGGSGRDVVNLQGWTTSNITVEAYEDMHASSPRKRPCYFVIICR